MIKQKSQKQLQEAVDAFNAKFSVGEKVLVKNDSGELDDDTIRHEATIMGGHTAMAWLEKKGSYLLERVKKSA